MSMACRDRWLQLQMAKPLTCYEQELLLMGKESSTASHVLVGARAMKRQSSFTKMTLAKPNSRAKVKNKLAKMIFQ